MTVDQKSLMNLVSLDKCPKLIEKYQGIAALPFDIPRFEPDSWSDFWEIWNSENQKVWRQHLDRGAVGAAAPEMDLTQWDGLSLFELPELYTLGAWGTKICQPMIEANPKLISNLLESLPFVKTRSIRLWSSHTVIRLHRDDNMPSSLSPYLRFPTEIRVMIDDKNPRETFWLACHKKYKPNEEAKIPDNERYYVHLPAESNTFAWNNEDYLHAADYIEGHRKILVVIKGWIDVDRFEELMDRSIERFPNYVIRI